MQDLDGDGDGRSDVWLNTWDYAYRDVVIVDADGGAQTAYNLTQNDLAEPEKYAEMKQQFIDVAATEPLSRWQSPIEPLDVDANSRVTPLDALAVINELGEYPPEGRLPVLGDVHAYVDTDGDGSVGPLDALSVINQLSVIASASSQAAQAAATLSPAVLPHDVAISEKVVTGVKSAPGEEIAISAGDLSVAPSDSVLIEGAFKVPARIVASDRLLEHTHGSHAVGSDNSGVNTNNVDTEPIDELFADLSWAAL